MSIILFGMIFNTGLGMFYGFATRLFEPGTNQFIVGSAITLIVGFIASFVGFTDLVSKVYSTIRSEEHTSELQSRGHIVCRLLLEKKNELITTCASAALCRSATVRRIYRRSLSLRIVYSVKYLLSYRVS